MKKKILVILCMTFLLTGCFKKESLTVEQVKEKINDLGYQVYDVDLGLHENSEGILLIQDEKFNSEYIVLNSIENAEELFESYVNSYQDYKGKSNRESKSKAKNYRTYKLITADKYLYASRVEDTLLIIMGEKNAKDKIDEYIKLLGY